VLAICAGLVASCTQGEAVVRGAGVRKTLTGAALSSLAQRSYVIDVSLQELGEPNIPGLPFNPTTPQRYRLIYQAPNREALIPSGSRTPAQVQIGDSQYAGSTTALPHEAGKFLLLHGVDPKYNPVMIQGADAMKLLLDAHDVFRQGNRFRVTEAIEGSASDIAPWPLAGMGHVVHANISAVVGAGRIVSEDLNLVSGSRRINDSMHFEDFGHAPSVEPPPPQAILPSPCGNPSVTLPSNEVILCSPEGH